HVPRGVSGADLHRRTWLLEPQQEDRVSRLARPREGRAGGLVSAVRTGLAAGRGRVGPSRGRPGAARRLAPRLGREGGRDLPHHVRPPVSLSDRGPQSAAWGMTTHSTRYTRIPGNATEST